MPAGPAPSLTRGRGTRPAPTRHLLSCERDYSDRGQDRLDQPGAVLGEVADEVGRLRRKVGDEHVESERRLRGGEESPHAFLASLGEVVPVRRREAGVEE